MGGLEQALRDHHQRTVLASFEALGAEEVIDLLVERFGKNYIRQLVKEKLERRGRTAHHVSKHAFRVAVMEFCLKGGADKPTAFRWIGSVFRKSESNARKL